MSVTRRIFQFQGRRMVIGTMARLDWKNTANIKIGRPLSNSN